MVTYGGMSKKPVTVPTSYFIFKVSTMILQCFNCCCQLHLCGGYSAATSYIYDG